MEHPDRPSRRKSHDKWKRIVIEPAGDSDTSEWSSDSDSGVGGNVLHYRHLEACPGVGPSPSGNTDQPPPTLSTSAKPSGSGHGVSSLWQTDYLGGLSAKLKSLGSDPGAGASSSNLAHLLHHDYAEREENMTEQLVSSHLPLV
ncbi:hypothetical protein L9F63_022017 [Diploptera punctata]|uniref:Uncharacterized protein n=1 Tax=Diploptera punctata TaxID=6984 RepID=A0AAD7ZNJ7_DIPPU|nr:hypothetical protein L9F63_022017 [Diploptera punctata]